MIIKFYKEIKENKLKLVKDINEIDDYFPYKTVMDNDGFIKEKKISSYFTPNGYLVDIFSDHTRAHFLDTLKNVESHIAEFYNYEDEKSIIHNTDDFFGIPNSTWYSDDDRLLCNYETYPNDWHTNTRRIEYKSCEAAKLFIEEYLDNQLKYFYRKLKDQKINSFDIFSYYHYIYDHITKMRDTDDNIYNEEIKNNFMNLIRCNIDVLEFYKKLCDISKNPKEPLIKFYRMGNMYKTDTLISLIGFDKIENIVKNEITTSRTNIYETFFNYLILDYKVRQIPKFVFNEEMNTFVIKENNEFSYINMKDREYEDEIKLIKKYVPYNERHKYFIK